MSTIAAAGLVVLAHLLGCFPSARLVGRRVGFDPVAGGSGNPGATNALRLGGRRAGASVLALDLAKGAAATGVGLTLDGRSLAVLLGAAAVTGHVLPVTRRFRDGGKGVATAAGAAIVAEPVVAAVAGAAFGVLALVTRRASAASLAAAVLVPVGVAVLGRPALHVAGWAAVAALVLVRHAANVRRLVAGTEPATEVGRPGGA